MMKRLFPLLLLGVLSTVIGCPDPDKTDRETQKRLRKITEEHRRTLEELKGLPKIPDFPCKSSADEKVYVSLPDGLPDYRIILKNPSTDAATSRMKISQSEKIRWDSPLNAMRKPQEGKLINVGCDQGTVDLYKGSLEVENARLVQKDEDRKTIPSIPLTADTVLVCDEVNKYHVLGSQIGGHTVVLKNLIYMNFFSIGQTGIMADRLILEGKNLFVIQASPILNMPPTPIHITVGDSLEGDGQLVVDSLGNKCPEKK